MKIMRVCAVALALMIAASFLRRAIPTPRRPETLSMAALPSRLGNFVRYGTVKVACTWEYCTLRHWSIFQPDSVPLRPQCPLCASGIDISGETLSERGEANVAARYVCVQGGSILVVNLAVLRAVSPDPTVLEPLLPLNKRGWFRDPEKQKIATQSNGNGLFRWVVMRRWSVANPNPSQSGDLLVCFYGFGSPQVASASRWRYLTQYYGKRLSTGKFSPVQTVVAWTSINAADDGRLSRFAEFSNALATSVLE